MNKLNEKIIIILLAIGTAFYCWDIYEKQSYYSDKEDCVANCFFTAKESSEDFSLTESIRICDEVCGYLPNIKKEK